MYEKKKHGIYNSNPGLNLFIFRYVINPVDKFLQNDLFKIKKKILIFILYS